LTGIKVFFSYFQAFIGIVPELIKDFSLVEGTTPAFYITSTNFACA